MQLCPQVQRQAPGLLGFEHRLVLREDGVLEVAQPGVGRIEIRHRQAEPHAARFRRDRADVERDGLAPAPHRGGARFGQLGEHRRVGRRDLVGVFDLRGGRGMQVGLRLPGLAAGGQQAGRRGLHAVVVDGRGIARAQPAFVHEPEVGHVEEVLDDARRAGRHIVGAAVELAQAGVVFRGEGRKGRIARSKPHPHQAVGLPHAEAFHAVAGRRLELRQRGHMDAAATALELPAVVGALEPAVVHAAEREARAAMGAAVGEGMRRACSIAPEDQGLVQEQRGQGCGADVLGQGDRVPVVVFDHRGSGLSGQRAHGIAQRACAGDQGRREALFRLLGRPAAGGRHDVHGRHGPAAPADDGRSQGHVAQEQLFAVDRIAALPGQLQLLQDGGLVGQRMAGMGHALALADERQHIGLGQRAQEGPPGSGAVHRDAAADGHVHGHELGADEARHIDHLGAVGLGEAGGFRGDVGEFGQKRIGQVDERVACQVVEPDAQHARR